MATSISGSDRVPVILTLSATHCEIRDFKTGTPKDEHQFQLLIYALLWWRDRDLNPSARLANRLIVSYDDRDIEIQAPGVDVLCSTEEELRKRTTAALATFKYKTTLSCAGKELGW